MIYLHKYLSSRLVYSCYFVLSQARRVSMRFRRPAACESCPSSNNTHLIPYLSLTLLLPHALIVPRSTYWVGRGRARQTDSKRERGLGTHRHESHYFQYSQRNTQSLINTGLTPRSAHSQRITRNTPPHTCILAGSLYSPPLPPLCVIFLPYVYLGGPPQSPVSLIDCLA